MKNITKLFAIAAVVLGFSSVSFAQTAMTTSTANATASASILQPILITKNVDLRFGTIGAVATASNVVMSTAGVRTSAAATLFTNGTTPHNAATFTITGTPLTSFAITLPAATASLTSTAPGATAMTIEPADWVSDLGATNSLDLSGSKVLNLGATLQVGASQIPGMYSGTFAVTVAYN